jgi:hypothetical protein
MYEKVKIRYLFNLLVAIDQFGNAICGGNPDCTISARVGYNVIRIKTAAKYYWKTIASIIDYTFWPLQGWGHCYDAYLADKADTIHNNDGAFFRALMTVIIVFTCVPISVLLYLIYPFRNIFIHEH